ncbi:TetR/AcrR family transcriptional regulator [Ancylobacter sonchi]|uniref:TetR/AcrR family transcriptional regulator n=1 Tax=Ancylobacter sonchi TaxID=1937790 RepID=UPI001BD469D5|nr:TetR/AcrR family transcriptional regulator [Ancylobacter sonchi]MBS7533995.1 TetR/AcrR family transcriptional regulator [Ancylobacter sonchi]
MTDSQDAGSQDTGGQDTGGPDTGGTLHRPPVRKRGIERFEHLLDATATLIGERPDEEVSLANIAARAGVPLASLYHFFPNRNAALVALAQRYHRQIHELATFPAGSAPLRWQDVFAFRVRNTARFLNDNPAALRLFMGAGVSAEVRNTDVAGNDRLAAMRADYLHRHFVMAPMPDLPRRIAVSLAILDGIWAYSYSHHRRITDEYVDEAIRATLVYLRCFLPEELQPRTD